MKKINLKGISEILSEKELKNVMGGSNNLCSTDRCNTGYSTLCNSGAGRCQTDGGLCVCK